MTDAEKEYGKIELIDETIIRSKNGNSLWSIPLEEIIVIGEFTTENGPYLDDWFLTLITAKTWCEIPIGTEGIDIFLNELGEKLKSELALQLINSTDWKTRIIWPLASQNKKLYDHKILEPKTVFEKIKNFFGNRNSIRQFSEETKKIISEKVSNPLSCK